MVKRKKCSMTQPMSNFFDVLVRGSRKEAEFTRLCLVIIMSYVWTVVFVVTNIRKKIQVKSQKNDRKN